MRWNERLEGETAREWLDRLMHDERSNRAVIEEAYAAWMVEKQWLLDSLHADMAQEWLIDMVLARWGNAPVPFVDAAEAIARRLRPAILDRSLLGTERR